LRVRQSSDPASALDGDSDGIPDSADQRDGRQGFANELQTRDNEQDSFLMMVPPGLRLELGSTARASQNNSASVTMQQIASFGGPSGDAVSNSSDNFEYASGIYDFRVTNLPEVGATVDIVIPQGQQTGDIPDYRKYTAGPGWRSFQEGGSEMISSTAGTLGQCPPPGDPSYAAGLEPGHRCVQLSVMDGGPNDADGFVNGVIADPGGVATPQGQVKAGSGGGGALGAGLAALLSLLWLRRRPAMLIPALVTAMAFGLIAIPEPVQAAEKGWYVGVGGGLSTLDPDTAGTPFTVKDDEGTGVKLFAGVDITDSFSAFGFFADLDSAKLEPVGTIDYGLYGAGVLYGFGSANLPRLSGFVKAGISQLELDADVPTTQEDDTLFFVGGGASWAIGRGFFVRAEYEYFAEDAQLLSVSLVKRFTFAENPPAKTFPLEDQEADE
jgi:hypothetical protein